MNAGTEIVGKTKRVPLHSAYIYQVAYRAVGVRPFLTVTTSDAHE